MSLIPYPSVPALPGVPALLRSATVPTKDQILKGGLSAISELLFGAESWGVFTQSGKRAIEADSFLSIEYQNGSRISNAPQEKGTFSSYNKVANPYDCSVILAMGADKAARTGFLKKLEELNDSVELFSIVTPERTYTNATLETFNYKREASNGVTLIKAQLNFVQIRNSAIATQTKPRDPSSYVPDSVGQLSPIEPTQEQIDRASASA